MQQKSSAIEEKIIQAAIDCIEKYGLEGTTNRKIAEMAGVNGAAINYYFRSKDALVEKCMQITLNNAFDEGDFARLPKDSACERYYEILNHIIQGGSRYPGLTRAHFHGYLAGGEFDPIVIKKINRYIVLIIKDLKENGVQLDGDELHLAVAYSFGLALFMALMPGLFKKSLGLDLHDEKTRQRFITELLEKLL